MKKPTNNKMGIVKNEDVQVEPVLIDEMQRVEEQSIVYNSNDLIRYYNSRLQELINIKNSQENKANELKSELEKFVTAGIRVEGAITETKVMLEALTKPQQVQK